MLNDYLVTNQGRLGLPGPFSGAFPVVELELPLAVRLFACPSQEIAQRLIARSQKSGDLVIAIGLSEVFAEVAIDLRVDQGEIFHAVLAAPALFMNVLPLFS